MEIVTQKRIAILMTVHNRRETTLRCLRHIEKMVFDKGSFALDIFMTDDGSSDGTAGAVQKEFPYVRIIEGDGSLFWNRGMIAAWQEAAKQSYDYYLWVNDDTFVFPDMLSRMLRCSTDQGDRSIIVGSTCSSDGSGRTTYGGRKNGRLVTDVSQMHACDTMNGNLVLVPRPVFERLGMNDPYYRHSLGDTDYGLRASEAGMGILVVPGHCGACDQHERPTVWMDPKHSLRERWGNFFSPLGNNPFEFFHYRRKHYGLFPAIATFLTNFAHFLFPGLWLKFNKRPTTC